MCGSVVLGLKTLYTSQDLKDNGFDVTTSDLADFWNAWNTCFCGMNLVDILSRTSVIDKKDPVFDIYYIKKHQGITYWLNESI